jgi:hypothetical protein
VSTVDMTISREDFDRLCQLRTDSRNAEDTYLRRAEAAKQAKKNMESAQDLVNRFLDEMAAGPLPLEQQAQRNRECESSGADPSALFADDRPADGEPGEVPVSEEPGEFAVTTQDEAWRFVDIAEIKLAKGVIKKLKAAGIATVGDLADFSTADRDLTSISGIEEATKNAIIDAMIGYFEEHPMPPKPGVVDSTSLAAQGEADGGADGREDVPASENAPEGKQGRSRRKRKTDDSADLPGLTPDEPESGGQDESTDSP